MSKLFSILAILAIAIILAACGPSRPEPVAVVPDHGEAVVGDVRLINESSFSEYREGIVGVVPVGSDRGPVFRLPAGQVVEVSGLWVEYDPRTHEVRVWDQNPDERK